MASKSASMRPQHIAAEYLTGLSDPVISVFASMRPQHIAAEYKIGVCSECEHKLDASMRPQHIAAEYVQVMTGCAGEISGLQ